MKAGKNSYSCFAVCLSSLLLPESGQFCGALFSFLFVPVPHRYVDLMEILFLYPPSPYLNHSMFKHYTYFAETVDVVSRYFNNIHVLDCAVQMHDRNEIYDSFCSCDMLVTEIEPYNIRTALSMAEIYKDRKPEGKTVFFGTAAVLISNYLSQQKAVDYVIANGEFAQGILDAASSFPPSNDTKKILSPIVAPCEHFWGCSLDASVPLERYRYFNRGMFEFTVQVGCPYSCSFCSEKLLFPPHQDFICSQRPVDNVLTVLHRIKNDYSSVYFSATTLTADKAWISAICEEMISSGCRMPWRSDTRVDCLDPTLLTLMKKSGLKQLSLGVESFEDHLLNSINKRQQAVTVYDQILMCKEYNVDVKALLILGLPGQSADDVLHTQSIIEKLGIAYRWKEYSPIRELYLMDQCGEDVSPLLDGFSRETFRSSGIPGLPPEKYMSLLFPRGYVR